MESLGTGEPGRGKDVRGSLELGSEDVTFTLDLSQKAEKRLRMLHLKCPLASGAAAVQGVSGCEVSVGGGDCLPLPSFSSHPYAESSAHRMFCSHSALARGDAHASWPWSPHSSGPRGNAALLVGPPILVVCLPPGFPTALGNHVYKLIARMDH